MHKTRLLPALAAMHFITSGVSYASSEPPAGLPGDELDLVLKAPIQTWDEALPLGNGLLGGLLWGEGRTLRLSLDRGDLWDNRHPPRIFEPDFTWREIQAAVRRGDQQEILRRFDSTYASDVPTKLPGGRLEIELPAGQQAQAFVLDLSEAVGRVHGPRGLLAEGFFSADAPVALLRFPGPAPEALRFVPPAAVAKLGYPAVRTGREGSGLWFVQSGAEGLSYAAYAETRRAGKETLLALTLDVVLDGSDPLPEARGIVRRALDAGYEAMRSPHRAYWHRFWSSSQVSIPDVPILRHYYLVNYYLGAASRPGAPPMPLQGSGPPTPAACLPGTATTTMISTRR